MLDAGHHSRSSHHQPPATLLTNHLALSGVAPFATPEAASLDTPAQLMVPPASNQVPTETASDTTHTVTGTSPADTQVLSLEASVTRPIQSGANLVDTQLPPRPSSLTLPVQSEVVFSGPLVPSFDTYRDSTEMAPLAISAQFEVAPLNTLVPSEPVPFAPVPKLELDTVIQEMREHCKTTDIGNNPVEILRHVQNRLVLGRALDVVDPTCSVLKATQALHLLTGIIF